jgi:hypothetical protein
MIIFDNAKKKNDQLFGLKLRTRCLKVEYSTIELVPHKK